MSSARKCHPLRRFTGLVFGGMRRGLWLTGMAVTDAVVAAGVIACQVSTWRPWRHVPRAERQARRLLGIPARHPERVTGSDKAAQRGHFPQWARELEADGIDAGEIINAYRRGM